MRDEGIPGLRARNVLDDPLYSSIDDRDDQTFIPPAIRYMSELLPRRVAVWAWRGVVIVLDTKVNDDGELVSNRSAELIVLIVKPPIKINFDGLLTKPEACI